MSTHSQRKGANGERELAGVLRDMGFPEATKTSCIYEYGSDAPDISGLPGIHVEAKRVERLDLHRAMAQSIRDARIGETPVVAHRRNRSPWMLTFQLRDLPDLIQALQGEPDF